MSYPLDSDVQEDVRTFPMYQRLRKINPYAYYSLNTQKECLLSGFFGLVKCFPNGGSGSVSV